MSLNWKEIDLILEELSLGGKHIRQIFQRDYRNIYFQLFSPAKSFYLRICLEQSRTRLHETGSRPPSKGKQPRFSEFLRSRIRGGRIEAARQSGSERIVCMTIRRADEKTLLYLKLWGNAANIIACDSDNIILEAAYRRPNRGEFTGETFHLPQPGQPGPGPQGQPGIDMLQPRPAREGLSYNQSMAAEYREIEEKAEHEHLLKELKRFYNMQETSLAARINRIEKAAVAAESADRLHAHADIILAQAWEIQKGASSLQTKDHSTPPQIINIPLDPLLSAVENAQKLYQDAKKLRARNAHLQEERNNTTNNLQKVEETLRVLADRPSLETLREFHAQVPGRKTGAGNSGKMSPGLNYSSQGFQILIGRTARENEKLLRSFTRGNDTWLHARDYPGAYVFIKQQAGKNIPLDVLLDAGNLALHYSKAKNNGQADLYYTQVKYLRRPKKGKPGLVLPTREKNLFIKTDEKRMKRLLEG